MNLRSLGAFQTIVGRNKASEVNTGLQSTLQKQTLQN